MAKSRFFNRKNRLVFAPLLVMVKVFVLPESAMPDVTGCHCTGDVSEAVPSSVKDDAALGHAIVVVALAPLPPPLTPLARVSVISRFGDASHLNGRWRIIFSDLITR
jgi:hypothetical protein